jgi:hypothetical protein
MKIIAVCLTPLSRPDLEIVLRLCTTTTTSVPAPANVGNPVNATTGAANHVATGPLLML